MAITGLPKPPEIRRLTQSKYIDSVRWLPSVSPFQKHVIVAFFDADTDTPSLEIHSLDPPKPLVPLSLWTPPSRISSLKTTRSVVAASTLSGSVHIFVTGVERHDIFGLEPVFTVVGKEFHVGSVNGVDLMEGNSECVSVGDDGRVNLVNFGVEGSFGKGSYRKVFDGNGLVSYTAVKWASPSEFVTGGYGFGLQWWDIRRPGGAVGQFKGNWNHGKTSGIIHSIDIHPSRKHTCLAGGSAGTVFAWDLRSQQQPIILSGVGTGETMTHPLSESEVWEVQCDCYIKSSSRGLSSSRILPAMFCSEDGILAVVEQVVSRLRATCSSGALDATVYFLKSLDTTVAGEEHTELLAEPCAINSFDIDLQNPSDIICSLEWESIAIVSRP